MPSKAQESKLQKIQPGCLPTRVLAKAGEPSGLNSERSPQGMPKTRNSELRRKEMFARRSSPTHERTVRPATGAKPAKG
jgi:hypothetical protein